MPNLGKFQFFLYLLSVILVFLVLYIVHTDEIDISLFSRCQDLIIATTEIAILEGRENEMRDPESMSHLMPVTRVLYNPLFHEVREVSLKEFKICIILSSAFLTKAEVAQNKNKSTLIRLLCNILFNVTLPSVKVVF